MIMLKFVTNKTLTEDASSTFEPTKALANLMFTVIGWTVLPIPRYQLLQVADW